MQTIEEKFDPSVATNEGRGEPTSIKIAYIGGGSREWALKLMSDLALSPHLCGVLSLHDIDTEAAERNAMHGSKIFSHPDAQTSFQVETEHVLEDALRGADFVVISIEPGHIKRRYADLVIPADYGILQTVGDTTGPGGIMRALRIAKTYEDLARKIVEVCPEAWVINYTNPMALCVRILQETAPGIKVFGCCHEVFGTQKFLAELAAKWMSIEVPPREEIQLEIAGVNHFTFATSAYYDGVDLLAKLRQEIDDDDYFASRKEASERAMRDGKWFNSHHLVATQLLKRYGILGAAGDRHLVEFLTGFLTDEAELHRWGVVATPFSWRKQRWESAHFDSKKQRFQDEGLQPSGEEGVRQMEALLGIRPLVTNVNLPNCGQMPTVDTSVVVETYAAISRNQIQPLLAPELPRGIRGLLDSAISEQDLVMQSIHARDYRFAFQALYQHPLVTLPMEKVETLFQEMVDFNADMLSEFS